MGWIEEKRRADLRIKWMIKHKINWMMGTISPAPPNKEHKEIESIREALDYYALYTDKVVVQTKWMGSYLCAYLNKDIEKSRFVSKGGYLINHLDHSKLIQSAKQAHEELFDDIKGVEEIIVEGELMPWSVMGSGLIETEYENYGRLHQNRLEYLKSSSIYDKISRVTRSEAYESYLKDNKPPQHQRRQYNALESLKTIIPDLKVYENSIRIFKEQLELFGSDGEWEFKPFNILKTVYEDGKEVIGEKNNLTGTCIDLTDMEKARAQCYEIFQSIKENQEEGIVIKPLKTGLINIPSAFKVRTKAYLQLIYGIHFDRDFEYYLEKRNIQRKLRTAISDYEIGCELIRIPVDRLTEDNSRYTQLLYMAIMQEKYLKTLDNRL